jgi:protein gp37
MGDKSKIEWTDATWNPVTGCTKVSAGCKNCYAERTMKRFQPDRSFTDVQLHPERLEQPLHWSRPRSVFVNSMSDLFHPDVPFEFVDKVFQQMYAAYWHMYQILTKRPERMLEFHRTVGAYLPNVWLGVSCEDQKTADERIPLLLDMPAALRFVSCEPLLGSIDLRRYIYPHGIGWVIVGGESGPHERPTHPDWVRSLRDQCVTAMPAGGPVPFFFKQWGEFIHVSQCPPDVYTRHIAHPKDLGASFFGYFRVGKRNAGRLLDDREWNQYPEVK